MNIADIRLQVEVPVSVQPEFEDALNRLLARYALDGQAVEQRMYTLSTELRELGLSTTLNTRLTAAGLDTVAKLEQATVKRVLRIERVNYASVAEIVRALGRQGRHLAQESEVEYLDLIEHLEILPRVYAALKEAGFDSVSYLSEHLWAAKQVVPYAMHGIKQALAQYEASKPRLRPE